MVKLSEGSAPRTEGNGDGRCSFPLNSNAFSQDFPLTLPLSPQGRGDKTFWS
jgi:hypothetical protein